MRNIALIMLVIVGLLLVGCQAAASSPPLDEEADVAAVTAAVEEIYTEYAASLEAGDSNRWLAQWTEDGVQLPPGAPPNIGTDMIGKRNRGMLEKFVVEMKINTDEVKVAGDDLAFARGLYTATLTPKAGGDSIAIDGKFLTVFQKQPDGSWKIYRDIFNSNVP